MQIMKEKLIAAIEAKNNDVKTFIWKFPRKEDRSQESIALMDASPEDLQKFYNHCFSMLYNTDKDNPGRYTLLGIIDEQRRKCNIELFLRKLETGAICADGKPYPRYLYLQDIRAFMNKSKDQFPTEKLNELPISMITGGLPREFERIPISDVIDGCLTQLGVFQNKHITFSFILNLGVCLTPQELNELNVTDANGKPRKKPEVLKEKLGINPKVQLSIKPSGLSYEELRAMLNLKPALYRDLTTNQLTVLRNKALFKLEEEVNYHISQWKEQIRRIELVAKTRGIDLTKPSVG